MEKSREKRKLMFNTENIKKLFTAGTKYLEPVPRQIKKLFE
jgi:hypothetical protein